MHLILDNAEPMHWAVAGGGIALVTLTLLYLANRRLGISTGFEDLCSLVLPGPYFRRGGDHGRVDPGGCRFSPASCSAACCRRRSAAGGRRPGRWEGSTS